MMDDVAERHGPVVATLMTGQAIVRENRGQIMAIQLTEKNDGKILEVQVGGKLTHENYAASGISW